MIELFYLLIFLPLTWEITMLFNINGDADKAEELRDVLQEEGELDEKKLSLKAAFAILLQTGYAIWAIVGLFTFQWPWFILLISLGYLIPKKGKAVKLDAILSILLLVFLAVNQFIYKFDIIALF